MGDPAHLLMPFDRGDTFTNVWIQQVGNIAHRTDSRPGEVLCFIPAECVTDSWRRRGRLLA